jgi:hypothetical protein
MTTFALSRREACLSWLDTAEDLRASHPDGVQFFAALETDARGLGPFRLVVDRLLELGGAVWTYSIDDGRIKITTGNRLHHICAGRNLITDYAYGHGASHILYLDADMRPPADALPKLLEMGHPLVGGHVPTYNLSGPRVQSYPYPVERHMNTAGFLLVAREVYRKIRWRYDTDAGMSDDPCYHHDAHTYLGIDTHVRKDVIGRHWPESIPPLEQRGYDRTVVRP